MRVHQFRFFSDQAHAWLEVPLRLLLSTGVAHKISGYSYMRGEYAYLEEDCDAPLFLEYFKNQEYSLEYITMNHEAPMRQYDAFYYPYGLSDMKKCN